MSKAKIAITVNQDAVQRVDRLVEKGAYESRSQAIEAAVEEKLARLDRRRLAEECAKLDPEFEKALAEEAIAAEVAEWPEY